jgi:hypothetical protein
MRTNETNPLVVLGMRIHGGALIEQAMSTRAIILADLDRLKAEHLLGDADIAELDALINAVHQGIEDRAVAASEVRLQTNAKKTAKDELLAARRRITACINRAFWMKPELREYRQDTYHGPSTTKIGADLSRKLAFAKQHVAVLAKVGAGKDYLDQVETKLRTFVNSAGAQEAAQVSMPESTRQFHEAKGRLYLAVKNMNNAGRALHANDSFAASKYTLTLFRRRDKNRPTTNQAETTTETPVTSIATTKAA